MPKQLYVLDKPLSWYGEDTAAADLASGEDLLGRLILQALCNKAKDTPKNGNRKRIPRRQSSSTPARGKERYTRDTARE